MHSRRDMIEREKIQHGNRTARLDASFTAHWAGGGRNARFAPPAARAEERVEEQEEEGMSCQHRHLDIVRRRCLWRLKWSPARAPRAPCRWGSAAVRPRDQLATDAKGADQDPEPPHWPDPVVVDEHGQEHGEDLPGRRHRGDLQGAEQGDRVEDEGLADGRAGREPQDHQREPGARGRGPGQPEVPGDEREPAGDLAGAPRGRHRDS
mmetsp:Transcript_121570/g.344489  ORF Transcript_121570/g.344489 Transcript_121570/m.344489 type:complete len:208 (-) Transcript_121570:696-1319(-)